MNWLPVLKKSFQNNIAKIMKFATISIPSNEQPDQITVKICDSFFSRFKGLMFDKTINQDEGIILIQESESRINSAIHMYFMNFDIAVFWLDKELTIIDKKIAHKWKSILMPSKPAKYIFETHSDNIGKFQLGDIIQISKFL
jgi:uncharacterized membrane protein (UPF0127 family)